jgi:hypothetical protein
VDVLPDRAQQHHVERQARTEDHGKIRQCVVDPANTRVRVKPRRLGPHRSGGLGRHHLVAGRGEPGGIASAAGADVENRGGCSWEEVTQPGMQRIRTRRLISWHH